MRNILIVEDNIDIHNLIKEVLEKEHYKVLSSYTGTDVIQTLENEKVDLILLDLMLPKIVISAKISPEDKVNVLLNGANDYITKPFNVEELLARVKVQLRIENKNEKNEELKYKGMCLSKEDNHTLYIKDKEIYLTKTEYAILKQLLLNPKQVITKTRLLEKLGDSNLYCDENSLKVHMSNIRKKIKSITEDEFIESVWGIGFKMKE